MTDLDCKQTEKLIPQFLKDELDNRTEKKFLNHVDGCSFCLEELSIQFLVTTGMQRLENGDTFDLNRELRMRIDTCLLYTSPSPRDIPVSRLPSSG